MATQNKRPEQVGAFVLRPVSVLSHSQRWYLFPTDGRLAVLDYEPIQGDTRVNQILRRNSKWGASLHPTNPDWSRTGLPATGLIP